MHIGTSPGLKPESSASANKPTHNSFVRGAPSAQKIYKAFQGRSLKAISPPPLPRTNDRALLSPTLAAKVTARQIAGRPERSLPRGILAHRRSAAFPAPHPHLQHDSGQGAMYMYTYTHAYIYMYTHVMYVYMYIDAYHKKARMHARASLLVWKNTPPPQVKVIASDKR